MRLEFRISDSLSCQLVFVDNWYRKMRSTAKFTFKGGDYSFINNLIVVVASYQFWNSRGMRYCLFSFCNSISSLSVFSLCKTLQLQHLKTRLGDEICPSDVNPDA